MPQQSPASSFHHLAKTTNYLHHYAIQFSQASCHFSSFGYKYSPQHHYSNTLSLKAAAVHTQKLIVRYCIKTKTVFCMGNS
jgi:hypothetical protein